MKRTMIRAILWYLAAVLVIGAVKNKDAIARFDATYWPVFGDRVLCADGSSPAGAPAMCADGSSPMRFYAFQQTDAWCVGKDAWVQGYFSKIRQDAKYIGHDIYLAPYSSH